MAGSLAKLFGAGLLGYNSFAPIIKLITLGCSFHLGIIPDPKVSIMNSDMKPEFTDVDLSDLGDNFSTPIHGQDHSELSQYLEEMEHNNLVEERYESLIAAQFAKMNGDRVPLFPWESHEPTYSDAAVTPAAAPRKAVLAHSTPYPWLEQFKEILHSLGMEAKTLIHLINQSSQAIGSSESVQKKMADVVGGMFPQCDFTLLNDKVASVYTAAGAYRDQEAVHWLESLNQDYEHASPEEKLVLSLAATKYILDALELEVSAARPHLSQSLATSVGTMEISVTYQPQASNLNVNVNLPQGGQVSWESPDGKAHTERLYGGLVGLDLFGCVPSVTYPMRLSFIGMEESPLTIGVRIKE